MSDRVTPKLVAVAGFVSAVALIGHFVVAGPPASFTTSQKLLVDYALQHDAVVTGAWLDGIGSILLVLTVIGVAQLAGAAGSLAGRVLLVAGAAVAAQSLLADTLLIAATQIAAAGSGAQAAMLVQVAHAADYVFPIANTFWAPALGLIVLRTRVLPAIFGYIAVAFGLVELFGGTAALYSESVNAVVNPLFLVMVVWNVAAGIVLLVRREKRTQVGREPQVAGA
jgi:Domain of unknown function (DUF4386)